MSFKIESIVVKRNKDSITFQLNIAYTVLKIMTLWLTMEKLWYYSENCGTLLYYGKILEYCTKQRNLWNNNNYGTVIYSGKKYGTMEKNDGTISKPIDCDLKIRYYTENYLCWYIMGKLSNI